MSTLYYDIQPVTSHERIGDVVERFFNRKNSYLKHYKNDIRVKFYKYINGKITLGIPLLRTIPEPSFIYGYSGDDIAHLYLKLSESLQPDILVFDVQKCVVLRGERNGERKVVNSDQGNRPVIYVKNFITETMLENSLLFESKRVDSILEVTEVELMKYFTYAKLVTKSRAEYDRRMQYISLYGRPLVVNSIGEKPSGENEGYEYYMNYIYSRDRFLKENRSIVSEAILPICYRGKFPYGYLRFNSKEDITGEEIEFASKFVRSIENHFMKNGIFPSVEDKMVVSDISSGGLSVVQFDKKFSKLYTEGNRLCFDLALTDEKVVNILATVKYNRQIENGVIRTGLQIEKMDAAALEDFNRYLSSLNDSGES
ncbi:MAG TPA: hypothetical protein PK358_01725 [Spirochaetota bacterium]|nr:hypothetical protein [Spirochaetota bacterium]HPJ33522.1 hypothetical protein [Spirochaetota bacterium]